MIEILDEDFTAEPLKPDFAALENTAIMIAENRNQQFVAQLLFMRLPIDIEVGGISTGRPVLEHVPPVAIAAPADRHVIGNDVKHLAELALNQARGKARVRFAAAELIGYVMVIDNIIAVLAAGSGLEVG